MLIDDKDDVIYRMLFESSPAQKGLDNSKKEVEEDIDGEDVPSDVRPTNVRVISAGGLAQRPPSGLRLRDASEVAGSLRLKDFKESGSDLHEIVINSIAKMLEYVKSISLPDEKTNPFAEAYGTPSMRTFTREKKRAALYVPISQLITLREGVLYLKLLIAHAYSLGYLPVPEERGIRMDTDKGANGVYIFPHKPRSKV